jgi:hypothetical protein
VDSRAGLDTHSVSLTDDSVQMNWKGCGRLRLWPNYTYYLSIFLAGLKKASARLGGVSAEIQTGHLSDISRKRQWSS